MVRNYLCALLVGLLACGHANESRAMGRKIGKSLDDFLKGAAGGAVVLSATSLVVGILIGRHIIFVNLVAKESVVGCSHISFD